MPSMADCTPCKDQTHQTEDISGTCIAQYESGFKTDAINLSNLDGSSDHGIFQVRIAI